MNNGFLKSPHTASPLVPLPRGVRTGAPESPGSGRLAGRDFSTAVREKLFVPFNGPVTNGRAVREHGEPAAGSGGFTLTETLVALCLGILVVAGLASFFRTQGVTLKSREGVVEMQQNLRAAMAVMTGELRMAGLNPLRRMPLGIAAAEGDAITFLLDRRSDRDGIDNDGNGVRDDNDPGETRIPNGTPGDPNECITYRLYSRGGETVLGRSSTRDAFPQPLAECVESIRFLYYGNAAGPPLTVPVADPARIRSVGIVLKGRTAQPDPVTGKHRTFTLASRVSPWNLQ